MITSPKIQRAAPRSWCGNRSRSHTVLATATKGVLTLGASLALAAYLERRSPVLQRIVIPCLPAAVPPLKILHLSDLHMTFNQRWLVRFIRGLADLNPNLVVSTGDNFSTADGIGDILEAYEPLLGFPGAFVFGSNDYYSGGFVNPLKYPFPKLFKNHRQDVPDLPHKTLRVELTRAGWLDLNNRAARVDLHVDSDPLRRNPQPAPDPVTISLVGVDDPHIFRDVMPEAESSWSQAHLRLGLTHAPYQRILDEMGSLGTDLVLAGHTHGGQICLPGGRALVANCDLPPRLASGLFTWPEPAPLAMYPQGGRDYEATWVHVSNGLGTNSHFPFRLFCRPSATLLELHPGPLRIPQD